MILSADNTFIIWKWKIRQKIKLNDFLICFLLRWIYELHRYNLIMKRNLRVSSSLNDYEVSELSMKQQFLMNWSRMKWQKKVMNFWQQKLELWFWIVKFLKLYNQRLLKQHAIFLINFQCQLLRTTKSQFSYCLNLLIRIDQWISSILNIFSVLNAQHIYIF